MEIKQNTDRIINDFLSEIYNELEFFSFTITPTGEKIYLYDCSVVNRFTTIDNEDYLSLIIRVNAENSENSNLALRAVETILDKHYLDNVPKMTYYNCEATITIDIKIEDITNHAYIDT